MSATALFPHNKVREGQKELIALIDQAIEKSKPLIVHAPTGLGKTAAALSPALNKAIEEDLTIIFVTPRHTQHKIVLETIGDIKKKHNANIPCADIIGKKWLCLQPKVESLYSKEFAEYCKSMLEDNACNFYNNLKIKDKLSSNTKMALQMLQAKAAASSEHVQEVATQFELCPYELAVLLARGARVIITDYFYMFNPLIRDSFLRKIDKDLENVILIVDEAHNLPNRVKDLATERITNRSLQRAINEAEKNKFEDLANKLRSIGEQFVSLAESMEDEMLLEQQVFVQMINRICPYGVFLEELEDIADQIREEKKQSYLGAFANFLRAWMGPDEGFARILSKHRTAKDEFIMLSYRCLDPSIVTAQTINETRSTILMSGTLTPTSMYAEILGAKDPLLGSFDSPFPKENRLNIIIPKTSTKFSRRSDVQFRNIAEVIAKITNAIPGNLACFSPSYAIRDKVYKYLQTKVRKTIFVEEPKLSKKEKLDFLERFKSYKDAGALLLGVSSGSFSEGIDLPGDLLKGVIIIGLPLQRPDLETKSLIEYFEDKFGKGWDYGYVIPAFNTALQSAGRCIRSEKDRGVIIFLDERYVWKNYFKYFPPEWDMKITMLYEKRIMEFFDDETKKRPTTLDSFS